MARIRTIKPEFWTSKSLARVSRDARLTFIGLWNLSDDLGVLLDLPRKIAGSLFPHEDVSASQLSGWLDELAEAGLILRASEKTRDFIIIRSWDEHQRVDNPSKKTHLSRDTRDSLARVSIQERGRGNGEGGMRKEDKYILSGKPDHAGGNSDLRTVRKTGLPTDDAPESPPTSHPNGSDDPEPPAASDPIIDHARSVLAYLNAQSGKSFRDSRANLDLIRARLHEYTPDDLRGVIDRKVTEWAGSDFAQYIRPATLFAATKCAQYVGETEKPTNRKYRPNANRPSVTDGIDLPEF